MNLQRSDATDGIRYAAGYVIGLLSVLFAVYLVMVNCAEAFTRTARSAMNMGGVSGSLRCAYSSGTVAAFIGVGLVLFFQAVYYLFMTLERNRSAYSQYGNLCSSNGIFCSQTLAWQQITGCVPIDMKCFASGRAQNARFWNSMNRMCWSESPSEHIFVLMSVCAQNILQF